MMTETYCTAFMEDLPPEKMAEGLGVQIAVVRGYCNLCKHYPQCFTDELFEFPKDAVCMAFRNKILKDWGLEGKA